MEIDFSNHVDALEDLLDIDSICNRIDDTEHDIQNLDDENHRLRSLYSNLQADQIDLWDTVKQLLVIIERMNQGERFSFETAPGLLFVNPSRQAPAEAKAPLPISEVTQ